ncbi:MAG: hypothetical protein ACP5H9_00270 [Candidatus Woesearchaeota archaeon]
MSDIYLVKGMELHFGIKSPPHTLAFFYDRSIENIFRKYCGKGVESTKEMIAELKEKKFYNNNCSSFHEICFWN